MSYNRHYLKIKQRSLGKPAVLVPQNDPPVEKQLKFWVKRNVISLKASMSWQKCEH